MSKKCISERPHIKDLKFKVSDLWYEGALLGNGDIGSVVFMEKNQIVFAIGKNDMWDRRRYFHYFKPITFRRYMKMAGNEWKAKPETGYVVPDKSGHETYKTMPQGYFPTPKPVCRIGICHRDFNKEPETSATNSVLHELSLENGELTTITKDLKIISHIQKHTNVMFISIEGIQSETIVSLWRKPDSTDSGINPPLLWIEDNKGYLMQEMPGERTYPDGFRSVVTVTALDGSKPEMANGQIIWKLNKNCTLVVSVATTRDDTETKKASESLLYKSVNQGYINMREQHIKQWKAYWDASWIKIDDNLIEHVWYFCNYLLASSTRPGAIAPGLFGPWIVEDTCAWHGSYTTDYNFEQQFAAALSCNHPELLEPYFKTIEDMIPAAREFAKNIFEADGIAFPHEIYPINMHGQIHAGSVYVCETPWLIQHFWEYYEYNQDMDFLVNRAYPLISECADFLVSYVTYEGDGNYSFVPTRSPEHHGFIRGLPFNRNGAPELAFGKYMLKAALKSAGIIGENSSRVMKWKEVLDGLPDYPRLRNQLGEVYIDCESPSDDSDIVPPVKLIGDKRPSKIEGNHGPWMYYNCMTNIYQVWPTGQVDMDSPYDEYLTAVRTWHTMKLEGSNDLVMRHVMAARLGIPTLREFKRNVEERLMLNGAITIKVNPVSNDESYNTGYFKYETNGIYIENCGLPLVINEMFLQSHNDVIKLFPTLDYYRQAEFHNLCARGGIVVSAQVDRGFLLWAELSVNNDRVLKIRQPWPDKIISVVDADSGEKIDITIEGNDIIIKAIKGKTYRIEPVMLF